MNCITSVDGIKVWLLTSLVNKLIQVMTLLLMKTLNVISQFCLSPFLIVVFCFVSPLVLSHGSASVVD